MTTTSLSEQLKKLRAPQSSAFKGSGGHRASLLFDRNEAAGLETDTVFALGKRGLKELVDLDETFVEFRSTLFNETSKNVERSILSKQENVKLNAAIEKFLYRLSPYLLLTSAQQTLEWLLFRFQINQYNVDDFLKTSLAHHESAIFVKILQLCTTPEYAQSPWYWLLGIRKQGIPLSRQHLLNHCSANLNFLQLICETSQRAREILDDSGRAMQLIHSFYVSVVCGTLAACGKIGDGMVGRLMPYIGDGLTSKNAERVISSCMIVSQLATKVVLTQAASQALLTQTLLALAEGDATSTIIPTAIVLCQTQPVGDLPQKSLKKIVKRMEKSNGWETIRKLDERYDLSKFVEVLLNALVDKMASSAEEADKKETYEETTRKLLASVPLTSELAATTLRRIFGHCDSGNLEFEKTFDGLVISIGERLREIAVTNRTPTKITNGIDSTSEKEKKRKRRLSKTQEQPLQMESTEEETPIVLEFTDVTDESYRKLTSKHQKEKFEELLTAMRAGDRSKAMGAKEALRRIRPPIAFFVDSLRQIVEKSNLAAPPSTKRKRRTSEKEIEEIESQHQLDSDGLARIVDVLETFLAGEMERSAIIVAPLFAVLKKCLISTDEQETSTYALQLCMSALVEVFKGTHASGVKSTDFDVDALVQCIRSTETPRVHQHAYQLLNVAAKLFKEDLVIRLMPIFSFMGRGLLRQDDSYTFDVIHRTIDNMIPPLLMASNNALSTVTNVFRDFVISVPHIPEHRRIILLKNLIKAASSCDAGRGALEKFAGHLIEGVTNYHLWIMIGLLLEYHVTHWDKPEQTQDQIPPLVDFALRLCSEFSASDQLFATGVLAKYADHLPEELSPTARHPMHWPMIFELKAHTSKQSRHFKYETITFVGHILSSSGFVGKLVELSNRDPSTMPQNVVDLFERLVQILLTNFERNQSIEKKTATNQAATRRFWQLYSNKAKACLEKINELLPAIVSLEVIRGILTKDSVTMKRYALDLLNAKLLQNPTPFTKDHVDQLSSLAELLTDWIVLNTRDQDEIVLGQCALLTLKLLVRVLTPFTTDVFVKTLDRTIALVGDWRRCNRLYLGNAALCLSELVQCLGTSTIPELPRFGQDFVDLLKDENLWIQSDFLLISILTALQKILEKLVQFMGPYLPDLLAILGKVTKRGDSLNGVLKAQFQHRIQNVRKTMASTPARVLVPAVERVFEKSRNEPENLASVFSVLNDHIKQSSSADVGGMLTQFTALFLAAFELREAAGKNITAETVSIEDECIEAFTSLALKISETSFRPIIFKLVEWASREAGHEDRLITLFRLVSKLYDTFRGLFNLFASHVIKLGAETLGKADLRFGGKKSSDRSLTLRINILDSIRKACQFDSSGFVTRERFDAIATPLVDQLEKCTKKGGGTELSEHLSAAIVQAVLAIKDDSAWKSINYQILLKTRHAEAEVRLAALKVLGETYEQLGSEVAPLVAETVPFLAELIEDENEQVESQCEKVIAGLENSVGSLREYF